MVNEVAVVGVISARKRHHLSVQSVAATCLCLWPLVCSGLHGHDSSPPWRSWYMAQWAILEQHFVGFQKWDLRLYHKVISYWLDKFKRVKRRFGFPEIWYALQMMIFTKEAQNWCPSSSLQMLFKNITLSNEKWSILWIVYHETRFFLRTAWEVRKFPNIRS